MLESLHDQTVAMMNEGARLDDIVNSIDYPTDLLEKPYLQPVYDEPEFVVRNTWRLYGGWYDGNPANLKPAPEAEVARAVAELAGGAAGWRRGHAKPPTPGTCGWPGTWPNGPRWLHPPTSTSRAPGRTSTGRG